MLRRAAFTGIDVGQADATAGTGRDLTEISAPALALAQSGAQAREKR